jgi:misacylated tRNA(Ala) deacylase
MEALFREDAYLKTTTAAVTYSGPEGLRFDRTIFYPTGGGQPGDTGLLRWSGGEIKIIDAQKFRQEGGPEDVLHITDATSLPAAGDKVEMVLDWERRYAHMRMHTCLHLLCSILKGAAVTGGQVGADKGRLDFNLPSCAVEKEVITQELNRLINEDLQVSEKWITDEELANKPELVRTMSVMPPTGSGKVRLVRIGEGVDLQPCGGTHVRRTSEIGAVEAVKIENKGKQNRRVALVFR